MTKSVLFCHIFHHMTFRIFCFVHGLWNVMFMICFISPWPDTSICPFHTFYLSYTICLTFHQVICSLYGGRLKGQQNRKCIEREEQLKAVQRECKVLFSPPDIRAFLCPKNECDQCNPFSPHKKGLPLSVSARQELLVISDLYSMK